MKKTFITLLAALTVFTACNLEGEEPLEEGVMTPEEFFAEIEIESVSDLVDGWWHYEPTVCYEKDERGNYKVVTIYGCAIYNYYLYLHDGRVTDVKRCLYDMNKDWEDIAITDPEGIIIDKSERMFSFKPVDDDYISLINEDIVRCKSGCVMTIDFDSCREAKNGTVHYEGHCLINIGDELPKHREPSYYDENGFAVYE